MHLTIIIKNWGYSLTIFFLALTGFAQMPIFKRYYLSDIPGLGWLAEFYITHSLHYIFAAVFISVIFYSAIVSLTPKVQAAPIGKLNFLKAFLILGLIITGGFMVFKNLEDAYLSHNIIIALDVGHLLCCMLFLGVLFFEKTKEKTRLLMPQRKINTSNTIG